MRWALIGAKGMLGQDLAKLLRENGQEVLEYDRPEIDITSPSGLQPVALDAEKSPIDVIVNTAAFTAVDAAEENEAAAFAVNAVGAQNVARLAKILGARLVHISTDYVMAGFGSEPYDEYAPLAPVGAYGRTKAAGEWAVRAETADYLIVRTAWLYGKFGKCFPKTMRDLSAKHDTLQVVTDEVGQPTWTCDLAGLIYRLITAKAPTGIYHGTSQGETSWFEFTKEIVASLGKDPQMVGPTTAAAFNRPAPRPSYSALGHEALKKIGVEPIGHWKDRWQQAASEVLEA